MAVESKHVEDPSESTPSALEEAPDPGSDVEILSRWPIKTQKRIIHKVDIRLIPVCGLLFCISLLDRTNLAFAAIAGSVELIIQWFILVLMACDRMNKDLNIRKVDGVDRYVSFCCADYMSWDVKELTTPVCHCSRILRHLYYISTPGNNPLSQNWTARVLVFYHVIVGRRHDRIRLCTKLEGSCRASNTSWHS